MPTATAFVAGGFGGACLALVGAPFDVVKVRQQIGAPGPFTVLRSILAMEGIRGLWRGATPPLLASVPQFAIVFAAFDFARRRVAPGLTGKRDCEHLQNVALAGALTAVPTTFIYTPCDRVKCVLQAEGRRIEAGKQPRFASPWSCASHLWRTRTLFRGFWVTLARDCPAWATYFVVYAAAKRHLSASAVLDGRAELSVGSSLAAGALAGASTWAVAIPLDSVKTRFQSCTYHQTYWHAARSIAARRGFLGFFAGFWTIVLGGVPRDAACFCGVETATRALTLISSWRRLDRVEFTAS